MRFQRKTVILFCTLLCAIILAIVYRAILEQQWLYPTPVTMSTFFKEYTPRPVVESFESHQFSSAWGESNGSSAGRRFITNRREFRPDFAIQLAQRIPLVNALSDDIYAQLVHAGASVSRSGDPQKGFQFEYILGKSTGTAILSPLTLSTSIRRDSALPNGIADIALQVTIMEKWFPKGLTSHALEGR
jgi:hypothetical protein